MQTILQHLLDLPDDIEVYEPRVEHAPIETLLRQPETERDEIKARAKTTTVLFQHGMEATLDEVEDTEANKQFHALIQGRPVETNKLTRPGIILKLAALLSEYDYEVVRDAVQMRTYITNRLLQESAPEMPANVRLRALENLGKITEVGLFTERTEITVKTMSVENLEAQLHEKLAILLPQTEFKDITNHAA